MGSDVMNAAIVAQAGQSADPAWVGEPEKT